MKKDNFGVWEITIPPKSNGEPAIPHDSKIKVIRLDMYSTEIRG